MNNTTIAPAKGPIRIDVAKVLTDRLGQRSRFIPNWLVRRLEKLICQEGLNDLLEYAYPAEGADFCRAVLQRLGVTINVEHAELLPPPTQRRVIIASNHPLGGLDGMALIDYFSRYYSGQIWFPVNDLLLAVKPLKGVFLPVNKHGAQSRSASTALEEAFAGDDPVLIFPAGLCSRRTPDGKGIADLEWKKMFVQKAIKHHRDIVPVFFGAENSQGFYNFARTRERIGLKFNIEMLLLPREIFRAKGKTFTITCGKPISWQTLHGNPAAMAADIRLKVYNLSNSSR